MPVKTTNMLFACDNLGQFLYERMICLNESIRSEGRDILNNGGAISVRLLEEYWMEPIRVNKSATRPKPQERIPRDKELTISFPIPFTGNSELLMYRPSSDTSDAVCGQVSGGYIVVNIANATGDPKPFRREFDSWCANMEKWLEGANDQARLFNNLLPYRIKDGIDARVNAILSDEGVVSALGYAETPTANELSTERAAAPSKAEDVDLAIPEREDTHNEFKETFSVPAKDNKSNKANEIKKAVAIAVAAFANTEGGRLFIGVNDGGKSVGLEKDLKVRKSLDGLQLAIRGSVRRHLWTLVDMKFGFSGEQYLVIEVPARKPRWVYVDGDFHVRYGNGSPMLNTQEAVEYQKEHG